MCVPQDRQLSTQLTCLGAFCTFRWSKCRRTSFASKGNKRESNFLIFALLLQASSASSSSPSSCHLFAPLIMTTEHQGVPFGCNIFFHVLLLLPLLLLTFLCFVARQAWQTNCLISPTPPGRSILTKRSPLLLLLLLVSVLFYSARNYNCCLRLPLSLSGHNSYLTSSAHAAITQLSIES